ncbi:MAG TPA: nitroreductase family deazaflavin-dependent oxidoreductase [Ktedonobacterales bacterium]
MPQKLNYFSVTMYMLTGGRAYRGDADSPAGFLRLTTIGRKSGKERRVHLLYIRDGASYVVTASNSGKERHPGWLFNLRSNPHGTIDVHGGQRSVVAEVAAPEKRKELWARLLEIAPMYGGYEKRTQREIPMVLLHPVEESQAAATPGASD